MNRRLIVVAAVGLGLLGGAGTASAGLIQSDEKGGHRICVAVTNDPNGSNRDGICLQTAPGLP